MERSRSQSGQVMVLVAVALIALIGSAALVLFAGSLEWQKNQLQQLADQAALDSAFRISVGCDAAKAATVITEADNFIATQRTRTGVLAIAAGTCASPYTGTDTFAGGLSETIHYPYRSQQQQVEVILTLALPISFGAEIGKASTTVARRAVAEALPVSVPTISATNLTCAGGQVNIAGSVFAQNRIARVGACAIYAHARLSPGPGTYSDLGDVSVFTDGQTWTAPGLCRPGLNAGSTNAICADGYEVSGHFAPACATAATSFLSAGDKAINPNPCALGTGSQPVAPRPASRPPEPNLDPVAVATLQGTGGLACTPGGPMPNIVVNGVIVGTGRGPAPVKDASGFYHFKPSCYGYLNVGVLTGGISNVQVGPASAVASPIVTPTLPVASQAGTLLVATIRSGPSGAAFVGPAGWVRANSRNQPGASRTEIWYYPNNPGGIVNARFGVPNPAVAQLTEWRNAVAAAPLDRTGTVAAGGNQPTVTLSSAGATTRPNELVITDFGPEVKGAQVYTPGPGWTGLVSAMPNGFASEYRLNLPAAVASETVNVTKPTRWSGVMATFRSGGGAVLDPGFYYFNGVGFAGGGGGICLNGGIMLARDVTLEFVNQAGFSSGTCAVGGGANCVGACQLGSAPCSLQPCPPNVRADPPNNLTWFAAPCSTAPSALDAASCPGSAWCTAGDRACSNLLIWQAPGSTGQIALKGPAVRSWLLGSIDWTGTCTYQANLTASIAGTLACTTLTISAGVGAGIAIGSDAGINAATVEAVLVE